MTQRQGFTKEFKLEAVWLWKSSDQPAAAIELAMRQPGQPLFNASAPGFRQQQLLGLKS